LGELPPERRDMESKYHECEALKKQSTISVQKVQGRWCWVFWSDKKSNEAHGIDFCPYCGEKLES